MVTMVLHLLVVSVICTSFLGLLETKLVKASSQVLNVNDRCPRGQLPKHLPHETECSRFYICQNGEAILQRCPSNLHFNPLKSVCDYPENAGCRKGFTLAPKGRINDNNFLVSCPKEKTGTPLLVSHPSNCGKFFICDDAGTPHPSACQKGLHFNQGLQACDYPETAGCEAGATRAPREKIGGGIFDTECPSERTEFPVLKPHLTDCRKFYICDGRTPHLKVCQTGLHFNPKTQSCDYPQNAGCDSGVAVTPRGKIGEEDSKLQCPSTNAGQHPVLLAHPTDCGKFYICDGAVPHLRVCQTGLHFNVKIQACDYPANVGCRFSKDLPNKEEPVTKGKLSDRCPTFKTENMVLVPDPQDCSKFFMCDNGVSHSKRCPAGLHFSTELQACDFPDNVKCDKIVRLLSVGVPSPFCPSVEGPMPIFYRHPSNCSVYYMCGNGFAYEFACPARLHFNLRQKICDYEWKARCPTGKLNENEEPWL